MELFANLVNGFQPLSSFAEVSILDVWLGSDYASVCCIFVFANVVFGKIENYRPVLITFLVRSL